QRPGQKPGPRKAFMAATATKTKTTTRGANGRRAGSTSTTPDHGTNVRRTRREGGAKNLVIVESPAKARTVENILGDDYRVIASVGHVRDLPNYGYGVEDFDSFRPKYVVVKNKKRGIDKNEIIKEIAQAAEQAENVFLSTDPDRE